MADSKGSMYTGKHALLPPKIPFPIGSTLYTDYVPSNLIGSRAVQKLREGNTHHHRTSSENILLEEQPSWLDDLLNEPETPLHRGGHRRSSSDSFAYIDIASGSNMDYTLQDDYRYKKSFLVHPIGSQEFDYHKDVQHIPFYPEANLAQKNRAWESMSNSSAHPSSISSSRENIVAQISGSSCAPQETKGVSFTPTDKKDHTEHVSNNPTKMSSEKMDNSHTKLGASETDTKRAKQQLAQRSRVRKLQYISELERSVQALQAEGSEVSAEFEFLNQQNLILSMENKALKQRLESLTQEQFIKRLEHEVLEKEIARLRAIYQQQQHKQQEQQQQTKKPSSGHRRSKSRDIDSQFGNLSLKP